MRVPIKDAMVGDFVPFKSGPRKIMKRDGRFFSFVQIRVGYIGNGKSPGSWRKKRAPDGKRLTHYMIHDLLDMGITEAIRVEARK